MVRGLTLKHMSILSGISISTLYKYVHKNKISPVESCGKRKLKYSPESVREILSHFYSSKHPIDSSKKRVAGFHFKGGTGKSALTTELSVMLALLGYKVLLVDGDQQGHASHILGFNTAEKMYTLYDCVENNIAPEDIVKEVFCGLDVLPANLSLSDIEDCFRGMEKKEVVLALKSLIQEVEQKYDFVLFDTAPSVTDLNRNIFFYSDTILLVCDTQPASVQSISQIEEYFSDFCEKHVKNPLKIIILPNKYEDRVTSSAETVTFLQRNWGEKIIPEFAVRKSEDMPRAFLEQTPISFFCKVNSIAFDDLSVVARHLIKESEEGKNG